MAVLSASYPAGLGDPMISSFVARCGIALVLMATCGVAAEHPPLVLTAYHARFLNHRAEVRWAVETWPASLQGFETKIEFRSSPDQRFQPLPLSMNDDIVVHPEATYAYASQAGLARVMQAMEDGLMNDNKGARPPFLIPSS